MRNIYNNNLNLLKKKQVKTISNIEVHRELKLVSTKTNDITVQVELNNGKKIYLHSKYRPEKEAEEYISRYDLTNNKNIVLIGFGFGYYAKEIIARMTKKQKLKIVISSPDIFKLALKNKSFKTLLNDKRVEIILTNNPEILIQELQKILYNKDKSKLIYKREFIKAIPKRFQFLKDILERIWIDRKNSEEKKNQIKENINRNLKYVVNSIGIKNFNNLFQNCPIFVISAGPSLDKNIKQLNDIDNKGLLVAVDTAIDPLLYENIIPDFIVTIESHINGYNKIFKKHSNLEVPLVYSLGAHYKIVKNHSGLRIAALSKGDISLDELNCEIDKGRINTTGGVSSAAIDFAVQLGGDPVVLVGQDLAIAQNKTHATNTFYKEKGKSDVFLRPVPGINKKEVYTDISYYTYLI